MTAGHHTSARRAHRAPGRPLRHRWGAAGDATVVVAAAVVTALLLSGGSLGGRLPLQQTWLLLALAAAGTGAAGAGVAALTPRLAGGNGRPHGAVAAALLLHSLVLMPASVVDTGTHPTLLWLAVTRLVASCCFVALLATGLVRRPPRWAHGHRGALTAVAAATAGGLLTALAAPGLHPDGRGLPAIAVAGGALTVALGHLHLGWREGDRLRLRLGLGLAVAVVGQLARMVQGHAVWQADLVSAALRLLGLAIVLVALTADFMHRADLVEGRLLDSDRLARLTAERDHEMRNVLTGLSGAAYLLRAAGSRLDPGQQAELGAAVQAELERLRELLARDGSRPPDDPGGHEVEPVLRRLVVLRRTVGADVELDADPTLRTTVPASALAQAATNLLANCERHAPGARVRVTARRQGGSILVEVADDGPGLAPGAEQWALQRGVRDSGAGGSGLGLYVSAGLLAEHGGTVRLLPGDPLRPGCTAVLELPAATPHAQAPAA